MRTDAEENRTRILTAAREVFAEAGTSAPMARVARRAGVAVATLYRRFPHRDQLVADAFADQHAECTAAGAAALRDPDPAHALRSMVHTFCAYQVADKGLTAAYTTALITGRGMEQQRAQVEQVATTLLRRAQADGTIRPGVRPDDFWLLVAGNAGVIAAAGAEAAMASRRYVSHMLRSFEPQARTA
ncbi:TetR/AcrR family transcriptional regulator [Amycolatopsis sp. GM8]|uniref:TetR/AcrR family transcriptional regulator n=1 Tax=Amycolatopsis sp. GM8 TaxID=2896530 RepID=UPI001F340038|nr:TetR/AcrR family transcriptional regulator [Amycolatopsis sp. GM8]